MISNNTLQCKSQFKGFNTFFFEFKKRITSRKFAVVVAFLLSFISLLSAADEIIPTGSFIINMGVVPQTIGNGLKPYGMVYDLVKNQNVPIKWVINPLKTKDGVDFSHNGVAYKGGPFLIPAAYRTAAVNARIVYWQSLGVVGATTTSDVTVPVYTTIKGAPRWTLDGQTGYITQGYLTNAGIPSTAYNWKSAATLSSCDDIYVMPHADLSWAAHGNLLNWNLTHKGAIWAACKAVSDMENMFNPANTTQRLNFLMQNGTTPSSSAVPWIQHGYGSIPYSYAYPTDPIMQFMGIVDGALINGAEQIYMPAVGWRPSTHIGVWDPTQVNVPSLSPGPAALMAYGSGLGDPARGKVMYEVGHSLALATLPANIGAQRAFLNFSLWAMQDKALQVTLSGTFPLMLGGTSYPLSASVSAGVLATPITYQWTSNIGGTFSNPTSAITTFIPPLLALNTPCNVTCLVTDACGRQSFASESFIVASGPKPPIPTADFASIDNNCLILSTPVLIDVLANDSEPDGQPMHVTSVTGNNGSWTLNTEGAVIYTPVSGFGGSATATYNVCDNSTPTPLCATGNITVAAGVPDGNGCYPGMYFAQISTDSAIAQTNATVTNPTFALADPDYDPLDNLTYAALDNNADILTLDFGYINTSADSVTVYFASGTAASSVTATISYSTNGTTFTSLGAFPYSQNDIAKELTFKRPVSGIRYIKIIRSAGTAQLWVDAATLNYFDCIPNTPDATDDAATTPEDVAVKIYVLDNDLGQDFVLKNIVSQPANGKAVVNQDGTVTYQPALDFSGTNSFTYQVCNQEGTTCSVGTVTVTVLDDGCVAGQYRPVPTTAPTTATLTAIDDSYLRQSSATTNYGAALTFDVGRKSTATRRGMLKFDLSTIPVGAILESATLTLTRTGGDANTLTFSTHEITQSWVEASTSWNLRQTGTAWTPSVGGTFKPTAISSTTVPATNGAYNWNLLSLVQAWFSGTSVNNGVLIKQANESLVDKKHVFGSSENGTPANRPKLTITYKLLLPCTPVPNQSPLAASDTVTFTSGSSVKINVKANDIDPNGNTLTVSSVVGSPTAGTAVLNGDQTITYTPAAGFTGRATFNYKVCDNGSPSLCDTTIVFVTVPNVPPVAADDSITLNSNSTNINIPFVSNDFDANGHTFTPTILSNPRNGTFTLSGSVLTYSPLIDFTGKDTISYKICEGGASICGIPSCDTAKIFITISNLPPVAQNDNVSTNACQSVSIAVLNNDSDPEHGNLTITSVVSPAHGTAIILDGAKIQYSPSMGFVGLETFTYQVCDNGNPQQCATGTINVSVNPSPVVNLSPVVVNDVGDDIVAGELSYIPVSSNDYDPDGYPLTVSLPAPNLTPTNAGTLVIQPNGQILFTPAMGFTGLVTFQYQVCDTFPVPPGCTPIPNACSVGTVTITVFNKSPLASPDVNITYKNSAVSGNVLTNDNDPENAPLVASTVLIKQPLHGIAVLNSDGNYIYTPNTDFVGTDVFSYKMCDSGSPALCDTSTVTIEVLPLSTSKNEKPIAVNDATQTPINVAVKIVVRANDSDPDGDPLSIPTAVTNPLNGSVVYNLDSTITYTPDANFVGIDTFRYRICDNQIITKCDTALVTIEVLAPSPLLNSAPIATDDSKVTLVNIPVSGNVALNDYDVENDVLTFFTLTNPLNGTLVFNTDGTFTYTPNPNFEGNDQFIYKTCDATQCDSATVYLTVLPPSCKIPSVGGATAYSGGVLCSTSNNGVINLTGQTGSVIKWQTSTDGGSTWTDLTSTTTTYNFTNAANNQEYRAVVNMGGDCDDAFSSATTISTTITVCIEICNDGIDNNGNGLIDCDDVYCKPLAPVLIKRD
jgi:Bacterial Ig domain/Disaggregatase related repeat